MKKVIIFGVIIVIVIAGFVINKIVQKSAEATTVQVETVVAVETATSKLAAIDDLLSYTGSVEGIHETIIISQTNGVATKVNMTVGQHVGAGSVLAVIHNTAQSAQVDQSKAQVFAAESNLEKNKADLIRIERLYKENVATKDNLEQLQLAVKAAEAQLRSAQASQKMSEKILDDTYIKASISGVISTKDIDLGGSVDQGKRVAQIVDVSKFKIRIMVSEKDAVKLNPGKEVTVKIDALPGKEFKGKINSIGFSSETNSRAYPVEVYIEKFEKSVIKSGMFARCEILAETKENVLVVPEDAIIMNNDGSTQLFVAEGGKAVLKTVKLGVKSGKMIEIISGLNVNSKVVTAGKERLADGIAIKENAQ